MAVAACLQKPLKLAHWQIINFDKKAYTVQTKIDWTIISDYVPQGQAMAGMPIYQKKARVE